MLVCGIMTDRDEALSFVKAQHKKLIRQLIDPENYIPSEKPFSLFMAGSPGSGKTEFSKNLQRQLEEKDPHQRIFRLDTDELRALLPQYTGHNSDIVQSATTLLFDKVFDYIQAKNLNVIVDTTFASPRAVQNVERALGRGRRVGIFYLYQDPIIAWSYTLKREKLEGRTVPKQVFINAYFSAKANVYQAKLLFGDDIELNLFVKDSENNFVKSTRYDVRSLDEYLVENYTISQLQHQLSDALQ